MLGSGASGTWDENPGGVWDWITGTTTRIGNAIYDAAGNLIGWIEDAAEDTTSAVQAKLDELRVAGQRFTQAYAQFDAIGPEVDGTPYAEEWVSIKTRADLARGALDSVASAAQSVYGYARSFFGLGAIREAAHRGMDGLGVLPAILSVAVVAGVVATVVALADQMSRFVINWQLVKQGKAPITGGGVFSDINKTVTTLALVGGAVLLLPHVLKAFEGRRS